MNGTHRPTGARGGRLLLLASLALAASGCPGEGPPAPEQPPASPSPESGAPPGLEAEAEARAEGTDPPTDEEIARASAGEAAREPVRTDWSGGDAAKGGELYALYCRTCHGAAGRGDGPAAPALNPKPRDFSDGTFYFDGNANGETGEPVDLARVIRDGPEEYGGSDAMPPWGGPLGEDRIRHLVAYVRSLAGTGGGG